MAGLSRLGLATASPFLCRTGMFDAIRAYRSAAAVQCYCDDDEYYSDAEEVRLDLAEVSNRIRGVQWVLIGDPGAKKHVYAEKLSKLMDVSYLGCGVYNKM